MGEFMYTYVLVYIHTLQTKSMHTYIRVYIYIHIHTCVHTTLQIEWLHMGTRKKNHSKLSTRKQRTNDRMVCIYVYIQNKACSISTYRRICTYVYIQNYVCSVVCTHGCVYICVYTHHSVICFLLLFELFLMCLCTIVSTSITDV